MAEQPQPLWVKSSYSGTPNNECLEYAAMPGHVLVRDSKAPERPHFSFSLQAWSQFATAVRASTLTEA